jgi:peptidoglycan/LPS O-acetylase OafA/YrhL
MKTETPAQTFAAKPGIQNPANPLRPGSRIPRLDFLRAVSAGIVVMYHSGYETIPAGFGVLTFFVISGFLITHLLIREKESTGTISFRNFYVRRSLRIFPPFYVYWIIAIAALTVRHAKIIWPQAICALLYVNNYYQGLHNYPSSLFSHTWSLGVEEQFYLLWPAAFVLFRNRLGTLAKVLLFVIPALWVYRSFLYLHGVSDPYIYTSFETRIDAILVGCLFAIVLHLEAAPRLMEQLRQPRYLPLTLAALALSVFGGGPLGLAYRDVVGFAIDPVLLILLILQLIGTRRADWMDTRVIVYLGGISYSTYLYQQLVIPAVAGRLHSLPKPVISMACLVGTWLIASISFELVEKPFLRLKERFTARSVRADREAPSLPAA